MRRGDIVYVDLEPAIGSEANKRRPAVVVSNDHSNDSTTASGRGMVTVVPLTSNTSHVLSFQVFLPSGATGLPKDSKAQAEQIRALSVHQFGPVVGRVPIALMDQLDEALAIHLAL